MKCIICGGSVNVCFCVSPYTTGQRDKDIASSKAKSISKVVPFELTIPNGDITKLTLSRNEKSIRIENVQIDKLNFFKGEKGGTYILMSPSYNGSDVWQVFHVNEIPVKEVI